MVIDIVLAFAQGRGGLEDVLTTVSNELTKKGHEVRIFQAYKPIYEEWTKTLPHIEYYGINNKLDEDNLETLAQGYKNKILETKKPDVIIATHAPALSYICRKATEFLGEDKVPIISWIHSMPEYFGSENLLQYSNAHLAISRYIGEKISNYVDKDSEIYYIGNPADVFSYKPIKQSRDKMKYIYIGRLSNHEKRLDVLFNALSLIEDDFEYELDIIGDGQDRTYLENLAIELNINKNINWLGWVDKPWEIVETGTVLLLSSDFEGFGMVLVEALGRGVPVISSEVGSMSDIIEIGKNGWIFEKGNYGQLYKILNNIYLGKNILPSEEDCKKSVEKFDSKNVVEKIETIALKYKTIFDYNKEKQKFKNLILSFISNKDFEQAYKFIELYKEMFEEDMDLKKIEIELLLEQNDIENSYRLVKEILEKDSGDYDILLKAGYLEFVNKNYLYSIKYYYDAFNINNNYNLLDIIDNIYLTIMNELCIDKQFLLKHDDIVGNIDINSENYMKFIYKKAKVYEACEEIDRAIRSYKTIILNTDSVDYKQNAISMIQQNNEFIKYIDKLPNNIIKLNMSNNVTDELISICVLAYRNLKYLKDTIDSILNQTYKNIEIIIGDDGTESFDLEIYKDYVLSNNKGNISSLVIYKNEINLGIVSNANKAISLSKGKYIKFIGSDDVFFDNKSLNKLYDYISKNNYNVIASNIEFCNMSLERLDYADTIIDEYRTYLPYGDKPHQFLNILLQKNIMPAPGVIFNRCVFEEYGMLNEEYMLMEDFPYWLKLAYNECKIGYLDTISVKYRVGEGVSSSTNKSKYYLNDLDKSKTIGQELKNTSYKSMQMVNIKSVEESIDKILNNKPSVSRYGDGEFLIMMGMGIKFQEYDKKLKDRLIEIIKSDNDKHIVCIPNVFKNLDIYTDFAKNYWNGFLYNNICTLDKIINKEKIYYNTMMSRPYMDYKDKSRSGMKFEKLKQIWKNKDIIIVEGSKSRLGVGNDLFKCANQIKRILCPTKNAFTKYDDILKEILKQDKKNLILIALGPTATVLAYDLNKMGYQAIDIGHIDVEYEWFLNGYTERAKLKHKFVNEAEGGESVAELDCDIYNSQIICEI